MKELKQQIQEALSGFAARSLATSTTKLLNVLGYESERTFQLSPNNFKGFAELFQAGPSNFDTEKAKVKDWQSIDIIFQLTEDDIKKNHSLFETKKYSDKIIESYLFFALSLTGDKYTRGDLVRITREINKLTPMPAMVLFKYNNYLTVAVIDRRLHKRESTKDVLEKVTLIKDINIAKPHRAHVEILHDLSFDELQRTVSFTNFVELHNAWRKTLDTSELNKKFFRELANWYFWALSNVEFPGDVEKNKDIRNAISIIRMITRLIFIWFVKEKGLVPDELFNHAKLKNMLNFNDKNQSTYYKAILQNLFFATLNTEMNKDKTGSRKFRGKNKGDGRDQHYMIHNVFRYEDYLISPQETLKKYFENIPFLNGGLFECLDKIIASNGKEKVIRIDGFSDHPKNALKVPDYLFFSSEQSVDLNEIYGTKNKTYKVRGLIDILDSYKFTVDENTPIEEEVALDPELLGKVFENLLASYNPETQTTARKQTGSFYTPREIVNYMVDESIIAYLSTKLIAKIPSLGNNEKGLDERLRHLVAYNDQRHEFTTAEADVLISAINTLKALDPACGSGAFPMGMLHKLVYILGKLDPDNSKWRDLQKQKAIKETEEAYSIGDMDDRNKRLQDISEVFENNASDYGRKLYLIENCIFGVDIQPIAVQIAKLRFFVSLIVDQRIDPKKANLGVRPLPNLETKFVAANTLIGIEKPAQMLLRNPEIDKKEEELKKVRERHFTARTPQTKEKYRIADEKLRAEISELLRNDGFPSETTEKLAKWNPYDQNASADFFDLEWMFGITDGCDVVLGNPPYISHDKIEGKNSIKIRYLSYEPFADIYCYFIECALKLQNEKGLLCYITSNSYLRSDYGKPIRKLLSDKNNLLRIINIEDSQVFESAIVNVAVLISIGRKVSYKPKCHVVNSQFHGDVSFDDFVKREGFDYSQDFFSDKPWGLSSPDVLLIQQKIEGNNKTLEQLGAKIRLGLATGHNDAFIIDEAKKRELCALQTNNEEIIKPILRGRDIDRFNYTLPGLYILLTKNGVNVKRDYPHIYKHLDSYGDSFKKRGAQGQHWTNLRACSFFDDFKNEKIVWIELTDIGRFALCKDEVYLLNSAYFLLPPKNINTKYLLGLLNSKIIRFYMGLIAETSGMGTSRWINNFVKEFPIPLPQSEHQKAVTTLVDQILSAKKKDPKADISALEKQIDEMVYSLYGLTPEEIAIVEGRR